MDEQPSPFFIRAQTCLWCARLSVESGKNRFAVAEAWANIRHGAYQQYHDLRRRGQTNREGSGNRRWRRYLKERPPRIFTMGNLYELVP
jgi:hypothetical protein